jgi:2-polyprenyl-6-methoxyphenol hydroxylase-like FAD-dependent oxidoreductase
VAQLADGSSATWSARYLVGTDGAHSRVRAAIGQPFPGRSAIRSVMLADVRLAQVPPEVLSIDAVGDAFALVAPFGDGWYRVVAWDRHNQQSDTAPITLPEVRTAVQRALGTDYGMHDARWLSRFHSDERQVPAYRVGRVLLAGDAAHVHSPAGGQGMNTGLQDAANLSWKLAAVCRGQARAELLDTYHSERHPVGATVLRFSGGLLRFGLLRPWQLPVVRAVVRVATRRRSVNRRFAGLVSGIDLAYARPAGAHPLTGRRAPDVNGVNGERLYEALRSGSFVLVGPGPAVDGIRTLTAPGPTYLVRPDGYISWAADRPGTAEVTAALHSGQWTIAEG